MWSVNSTSWGVDAPVQEFTSGPCTCQVVFFIGIEASSWPMYTVLYRYQSKLLAYVYDAVPEVDVQYCSGGVMPDAFCAGI
jgi:hypothetical protein